MRGGVLAGYRGHVDAIEPVLSGWVSAIEHHGMPVGFALRLDRARSCTVVADRPRPDVAAAGLAHRDCGFAVNLPARLLDGAEHELAMLLPDGRDLGLPGLPARVALGPVLADLVPAGVPGLDAVLDLLRRNDDEAGFDPHLVGPRNAAAFDAIQSPAQGFLYYARAGGRLVGYGRLDRGGGAAASLGIVALTVLAAYRRKGLGEALLRALQRDATVAGLRQVWLAVRPDNIPALRLYDKLGFLRKAASPPGSWAARGELTMLWTPR